MVSDCWNTPAVTWGTIATIISALAAAGFHGVGPLRGLSETEARQWLDRYMPGRMERMRTQRQGLGKPSLTEEQEEQWRVAWGTRQIHRMLRDQDIPPGERKLTADDLRRMIEERGWADQNTLRQPINEAENRRIEEWLERHRTVQAPPETQPVDQSQTTSADEATKTSVDKTKSPVDEKSPGEKTPSTDQGRRPVDFKKIDPGVQPDEQPKSVEQPKPPEKPADQPGRTQVKPSGLPDPDKLLSHARNLGISQEDALETVLTFQDLYSKIPKELIDYARKQGLPTTPSEALNRIPEETKKYTAQQIIDLVDGARNQGYLKPGATINDIPKANELRISQQEAKRIVQKFQERPLKDAFSAAKEAGVRFAARVAGYPTTPDGMLKLIPESARKYTVQQTIDLLKGADNQGWFTDKAMDATRKALGQM